MQTSAPMPLAENRHLGGAGEAYPDACYQRLDGQRFQSTLHAQGAWQPGEQHLAPAAGLMLAEVERRLPTDKQISRASFDVLGIIPSGEFSIEVEVLRPGRSIELIGVCMRHDGQASIRGRIWRLAGSDTRAIQAVEWMRLPSPGTMSPLAFSAVWGGGFVRSLEVRQDSRSRPGRGRSWIRARHPLVAGEVDPLVAGFLKVVDTANGLVARHPPDQVYFPNVDLTVHLVRQPIAGWVGFDTRVNVGPGGLGETSTILSDIDGPVGTVAQSLTVRLREP